MSKYDVIDELLAKIPCLAGEKKKVFLTTVFFKRLSDLEFTVIWNLPNLDVMCSADTIKYIEERKEKLNLKESEHAKIQKLIR